MDTTKFEGPRRAKNYSLPDTLILRIANDARERFDGNDSRMAEHYITKGLMAEAREKASQGEATPQGAGNSSSP